MRVLCSTPKRVSLSQRLSGRLIWNSLLLLIGSTQMISSAIGQNIPYHCHLKHRFWSYYSPIKKSHLLTPKSAILPRIQKRGCAQKCRSHAQVLLDEFYPNTTIRMNKAKSFVYIVLFIFDLIIIYYQVI